MRKVINAHMALLAVGVLQPASAQEVRGFLARIFGEGGALPDIEQFDEFLIEQERAKRVIRLKAEGTPYYSLTLLGTLYMPPDFRKRRDKFRAYLLRDSHRGRFIKSRVLGIELAGVSPASDTSSTVKGRAANNLGRTAFGRRFTFGQAYWPRIQGQFAKRTGLTRRSRDTFPSLLSFEDKAQAAIASEREFSFDYVGIGLCLGLSPQLIWNISRQQDRHYRVFEIPKRAGGVRQIESPRIFLKVIQWFLADFVLDDLPFHDSVHSFAIQRSIATNAAVHVGRRFVGNADIENFFGSISENLIIQHLQKNGFRPMEAVSIAKLCTNRGALPQGAPTSPIISNSVLIDIDQHMSEFCEIRDLKYSRYADDISVSGNNRDRIAQALAEFGKIIPALGLKLNEKKTRIASAAGQQKVTGVIVNVAAMPPRLFRRRARASFHRASQTAVGDIRQISELGGILGFLKIFPHLRESGEVKSYEQILSGLKAATEAVPP